jgi:hypothetical protein
MIGRGSYDKVLALGYDSYDLGSWHVIAINAKCDTIGGCAVGDPEEEWPPAGDDKACRTCARSGRTWRTAAPSSS